MQFLTLVAIDKVLHDFVKPVSYSPLNQGKKT